MFCGKCGNKIPDDGVCCSKCGAPVKKKSSPEPMKTSLTFSGKTEKKDMPVELKIKTSSVQEETDDFKRLFSNPGDL